jgi:hypothetical protein
MPTTIKLTSPIFDKSKRNQALSNAVGKTVREFAAYVPQQQAEGPHTGKVYRRKGGLGFRRSHRASATGQRPAPDTGKLLRSTKHKKTGQFSGEVTTIAKNKGFDYASQLQEKMNRPIQDAPEDLRQAQKMLDRNGEAAIKKLT